MKVRAIKRPRISNAPPEGSYPSNRTPRSPSAAEPPAPPGSDVGERGGGDEADGEGAGKVVVLATAAVAEVERVLLLALVGVAEEDHLT